MTDASIMCVMEKRCQIMLRVSQDTRDEIERHAVAENRSMANLTRVILEEWLAAHPWSERSAGGARGYVGARAE
jgi:hypothetical protein